jgi:creatinine amidohydrolase
MGFPGTMSLRATTLMAVLEDLYRALYHHGFRRILVVNGHGGNTAVLYCAILAVAQDLPDMRFKIFEWWKDPEVNRIVLETMGEQEGSHASAAETAFMMAVCPDAVKLQRLTGHNAPVIPSRELSTVQTFAQQYPDGIMGLNPHTATAEAGKALLKKSVEICSRELTEWPAISA